VSGRILLALGLASAAWAGLAGGAEASDLFRQVASALAGAPGTADVQSAYDAAKPASGSRHIDDLVIREAQCDPAGPSRFACQIDFVRAREPEGRLYFTVVTLDGSPGRWKLTGGLCKGP
jgi:hypothetical protein